MKNLSGSSDRKSGSTQSSFYFANSIIKKRKLKDLAAEFLNAEIQTGHHSSIIDARAALALYRMNYEAIETSFRCQEALKEIA